MDHQYEKVWHEQDAEGVASFYTTDAKIMAASMDVFHGRDGMQAILWYISANFGLATQNSCAYKTVSTKCQYVILS